MEKASLYKWWGKGSADLSNTTVMATSATATAIQQGDIIYFGRYPQGEMDRA
jgi:hypothetical protein